MLNKIKKYPNIKEKLPYFDVIRRIMPAGIQSSTEVDRNKTQKGDLIRVIICRSITHQAVGERQPVITVYRPLVEVVGNVTSSW